MPKIITVSKSYNVTLNENSTMEQYAEVIQKALDKLKKDKQGKEAALIYEESDSLDKSYNAEEVHELWHKDEQVDTQSVKENTKKYASNASKGKLPKSIKEFLRELSGKAELSWQDYLKRMLGTLPAGYKRTTTRKDRRQPDRLDLRGKLRQHTAELTVAIDISGSISDSELKQIMQEVLGIVKNYPHELSIMECDSEVRRIYKVKSIKDIRKKLNTRGATKFSPVFQYVKDNNMRNHILIYFTDGLGENNLETVPVNRKTIWVLTGKGETLSLSKPYGVIRKLNNNKIEKPEFEYAPNAIKEYRMLEWSSF
jgi:predicted metal-dependent peptidase